MYESRCVGKACDVEVAWAVKSNFYECSKYGRISGLCHALQLIMFKLSEASSRLVEHLFRHAVPCECLLQRSDPLHMLSIT